MATYTVVEKDKEFIPEWDDNRDRLDDEQIKFTLKYIPTSQRSKCWKVSNDGTVDANYELLIRYGVVKIENFTTGDGRVITSGSELGKLPGFDALYMEVATEILIMNAREDSKN